MPVTPDTRDLARLIFTYEGAAGQTQESMEPTILRVYDKLRLSLCAFAGAAGFRSIASRALALAKAEDPGLADLYVDTDGFLSGIAEPLTYSTKDEFNENGAGNHVTDNIHLSNGGILLIARILGLLFIFLGEALTIGLLRDAWPGAAFDNLESGHGRTQ